MDSVSSVCHLMAKTKTKREPSARPAASKGKGKQAAPAASASTAAAAPPASPDVVVLGSHPACSFAAALLMRAGLSAAQIEMPGEAPSDRLVFLNPELFDLHELLAGMKKSLELTPVYGVQFLADDPKTHSEFVGKNVCGYVAPSQQVRGTAADMAVKENVRRLEPRDFQIVRLDESGVDLLVDGKPLRTKLLIVGCALSPQQRRQLGLPDTWDADVPHRYTYLRLKGSKWIEPSAKPVMPMSLDLRGKLYWAWLLPGHDEVMLAVEQPITTVNELPPHELMRHWADVLTKHDVLKSNGKPID